MAGGAGGDGSDRDGVIAGVWGDGAHPKLNANLLRTLRSGIVGREEKASEFWELGFGETMSQDMDGRPIDRGLEEGHVVLGGGDRKVAKGYMSKVGQGEWGRHFNGDVVPFRVQA